MAEPDRDELDWQIAMAKGSKPRELDPVEWLAAVAIVATFLLVLVAALWWVMNVWLLP